MNLARPEAPRISIPLGRHLAKIRIERGLSLADVTRRLRYSERQFKALESDDFAALPGATIVRGMIRGYATFLKIDPEPLLAELQHRLVPVNKPNQARMGLVRMMAHFLRAPSD